MASTEHNDLNRMAELAMDWVVAKLVSEFEVRGIAFNAAITRVEEGVCKGWWVCDVYCASECLISRCLVSRDDAEALALEIATEHADASAGSQGLKGGHHEQGNDIGPGRYSDLGMGLGRPRSMSSVTMMTFQPAPMPAKH